MDIVACESWISDLMEKLANKKILSDQFLLLVFTRRRGDHMLVARKIHKFCTRIERSLTEISNYLRGPNMDYAKATICAVRLQIKVCGIGARSIRLACCKLVMASSTRKDITLHLLAGLHDEYFRARPYLINILKMEMRISSLLTPRLRIYGA